MSDFPPKLPRALLFDMDGTLTQPLLDFPKIKAELGIGSGPILESIAEMENSRRQMAQVILMRHERLAAEQSTLNPGCVETLQWLGSRKIPVAMITRNSRECASIILQKHRLVFDIVIAREDGPYKPNPFGLNSARKRLEVEAGDTWIVGDGEYDIEAAAAAQIPSVWLSHGRQRHFSAQPWKTILNLHELLTLLKSAKGTP
jgi:HAD superfamily hydrolase (TIGR01509 family)